MKILTYLEVIDLMVDQIKAVITQASKEQKNSSLTFSSKLSYLLMDLKKRILLNKTRNHSQPLKTTSNHFNLSQIYIAGRI